MMRHEIWFYRVDQAQNLTQALEDGAVCKWPLDAPAKNLLDGLAADAVELIGLTADMMEHNARIEYNLVALENGHEFIIDRKVRPS
jgi:hypothetical protein